MKLAKTLSFEEIMPPDSQVGRSGYFLGLLADGVALSNALDQVDWSTAETALHLCDYCGAPGCGVADSVLRNVAGYLCVIPIVNSPEGWSNEEHLATADRTLTQGMLLSPEQCETLRSKNANIAAISSYPTMSEEEQQRSLWAASPPDLVQGTPDRLTVLSDRINACSHGDPEPCARFVERAFRSQLDPAADLSAASIEESISFYLGEPDWGEWTPMCKARGTWFIVVAGGRIGLPVAADLGQEPSAL